LNACLCVIDGLDTRARDRLSGFYWVNAQEEDHPVRAFTKSLVEFLQLDRRVRPHSVGEKI
jgi:hypothetical protein